MDTKLSHVKLIQSELDLLLSNSRPSALEARS